MLIYQTTLDIKPKPYPYSRLSSSGNVYIPADFKNYKNVISEFVSYDYIKIKDFNIYTVELIFNLATSNYTSKNAGDVDNLAKGILDALQGIIWNNDAQVTRLKVSKYPAVKPSIYILVEGFD